MKSKKDEKQRKISDAERQQQVDRLIQASYRLVNEINNDLKENQENLTSFIGIFRISSTDRSDAKIDEIKNGKMQFGNLTTSEKAALIKKIFRTMTDLGAPVFNYDQFNKLAVIQGQLDSLKERLATYPKAKEQAKADAIEEARAELRALRLTEKNEQSPEILAGIQKVKDAIRQPGVVKDEIENLEREIKKLEAHYNTKASEILAGMPLLKREMVMHFFEQLNDISQKDEMLMPASNLGIAAAPSFFSDLPMENIQQNTLMANKIGCYMIAHAADLKIPSLKEKLQNAKIHETIVQFSKELKTVVSLEELETWVEKKTSSPEYRILMKAQATPQDTKIPPGIVAFNKMVENKKEQLNRPSAEDQSENQATP